MGSDCKVLLMKKNQSALERFKELVTMKYQLYNGLFLTLPFEHLSNTGVQLPVLTSTCREFLEKGRTPKEIIEHFFSKILETPTSQDQIKILFQFLQFVERQVVLFDALEDAAFASLNDLDGTGTLTHFLERIEETGKTSAFQKALEEYKIRIVLTAHPTQFYPHSVLGIISDLAEAISKNNLMEINTLLLQMGKTPFKNRQKPTPFEEAKSLLWYLENVFYKTLPAIHEKLNGLEKLSSPKIELGFWPGGDRDGNPFVTSEVTLKVASTLKQSILKLYLEDIQKLIRRLTFDGILDALLAIQNRIQASLPGNIQATNPASPYTNSEEFLKDLLSVKINLLNHHQGLFLDSLNTLIHKTQIFGFFFAKLDLRQNSVVHGSVLDEVFPLWIEQNSLDAALLDSLRKYPSSSSEEKLLILQKLLQKKHLSRHMRGLTIQGLSQETLESFRAARIIQTQNGEEALNRYVISNTHSSLNVLEVMLLAHLSGWNVDTLPLDLIPLFETILDLKNASKIMQDLYSNPFYRAHLQRRGNTQTIMVGFSDGTKDGGYFTANWFIFKAKQALSQISRAFGIKAVFFDGRGGPPSRGGGNTHKFYRSMGSRIEQKEIQLTIQGQTISSNFGTPEAAMFNLEQLFTAGLEQKLFPEEMHELSPEDEALLESISEESYQAYLNFKNHELFVPYLEEMTPLNSYDLLNIASRPAKRESSSVFRFEDLRAIPFVGAWSQMKQNIAGYYGFGSALSVLNAQGKKNALSVLYQKSLFFRTLVQNSMQALSKSYLPLTHYIKKDKKFGKFWERIFEETVLTQKLLQEVSDQSKLLETVPVTQESIFLREQIVLPLLVTQHYALMKLRELKNENSSDSLETQEKITLFQKIIVKSLAANINASRNSA
jgi:phosphoenolpyruvate carboxylase